MEPKRDRIETWLIVALVATTAMYALGASLMIVGVVG